LNNIPHGTGAAGRGQWCIEKDQAGKAERAEIQLLYLNNVQQTPLLATRDKPLAAAARKAGVELPPP